MVMTEPRPLWRTRRERRIRPEWNPGLSAPSRHPQGTRFATKLTPAQRMLARAFGPDGGQQAHIWALQQNTQGRPLLFVANECGEWPRQVGGALAACAVWGRLALLDMKRVQTFPCSSQPRCGSIQALNCHIFRLAQAGAK